MLLEYCIFSANNTLNNSILKKTGRLVNRLSLDTSTSRSFECFLDALVQSASVKTLKCYDNVLA